MSSRSQFLDWLEALTTRGDFPADRSRQVALMTGATAYLGQPQTVYQTIHVAGSKGKGSVSAMIAAIVAERLGRVGLYQSPHVSDLRERIRTEAGFFPEEIYSRSAQELYQAGDELIALSGRLGSGWSWFNALTLWGFLAFRQAGVPLAVIEVGLGGAHDSTNVVAPQATVVTAIEREHTQVLGDTLSQIAREKAGIIKQNVPVIIQPQPPEAQAVLLESACARQAPAYLVEEWVRIKDVCLELAQTRVRLESQLFARPVVAAIPLVGRIQALNAATAALVVKVLWPDFPEELIEAGLQRVSLPGRFEIITDVPRYPAIPALVLDGAHTPESLRVAGQTWHEWCQRFGVGEGRGELLLAGGPQVVAGAQAGISRADFARQTLTQPGSGKTVDLAAAAGVARAHWPDAALIPDSQAAIKKVLARAQAERRPILVTGSFYLLGVVKEWLGLPSLPQKATFG